MRQAGLLFPVSAIPSEHGIGDFGPEFIQVIDRVEQMGMKILQILPLNPLGYGNSPYQSYSAMAGDEIYISLTKLAEEGLITSELQTCNQKTKQVDYDQVRQFKLKYLHEAYENFQVNEDYQQFVMENEWLENYSLYMTFKAHNQQQIWYDWDERFKHHLTNPIVDLVLYQKEIDFHKFLQYTFNRQWQEVKAYANQKKIKIMGDIPIYVSIDSADVWENQDAFLLDKAGRPTHVAGVPPDYFSKTGQRWGNPLYDWDYLKADKFSFWIKRLAQNNKSFDILRIDHFRAFDTYWSIPSGEETAINGEWLEAPGYMLFNEIYHQLPNVEIVVEDLGDLRPEVHKLRDNYNLMGMKIVQFEFDPNESNNEFADRKNMIIYTGTHDNQTLSAWIKDQSSSLQAQMCKKLKCLELNEGLIEYTLNSKANLAILPIQDILKLDDRARFNVPGTVNKNNWSWRMTDFGAWDQELTKITNAIFKAGRSK